MPTLDPKIIKSFKDKEFAHEFMDEIMNAYIATQIKTLRLQKGWTQKQLADAAGTHQERIAVLENVNYSSWSISALREIARALDLVVSVSFENFSRTIPLIDRLHTEALERTPREEDLFPDIKWSEEVTRQIDTKQKRGLRKLQERGITRVAAQASHLTEWSMEKSHV